MDLYHFINKEIINLYNVLVTEDGEDYLLDDTFVFKFNDDSLIQILIDYNNLIILKVEGELTNIKVLGDYEENSLKCLKEVKFEISDYILIKSIENYVIKSSNFIIGSKFLNDKEDFIFALVYGFDEMEVLFEEDIFSEMVENYEQSDSSTILIEKIKPNSSDL